MNNYWGYHLILDCKNCDISKITDDEVIRTFVQTLVARIDMVAYGDPTIVHFATHDPQKAGYSLVQLIETSSITAHFVDINGDGYLDVFSCKPFSIEDVEETVVEFFNPLYIRKTYLTRQA
jgi:S-adenosylmethionine/arginine decarboxylase-like enzyme